MVSGGRVESYCVTEKARSRGVYSTPPEVENCSSSVRGASVGGRTHWTELPAWYACRSEIEGRSRGEIARGSDGGAEVVGGSRGGDRARSGEIDGARRLELERLA